ncbi:aldehyde dehydrogenase family protein [Bacillus massiliigorillae]|uniref:aldehyde dehydrogenase family protein n=1 Tax=Bacillus massiliigorillae TaxID=1243664 RepID=UPI00039D2D0F|nr:aldehyde dehydrogenase family protein [Bacillus massiliigorillae]
MTTTTTIDLKMYINGEWVASGDRTTIPVINPASGEVFAQLPQGTVADVKEAVDAARKAFDSGVWSGISAQERSTYLLKIADKIEEYQDELVPLETQDNGKTLTEAGFDVADAAACFRYYAGLIKAPDGQTYHVGDPMQAMVVREPVGVCGLIVPWNFPLLMSVWKIAPALAAGNTIVFKPSEVTPVTPQKLIAILEEVGIPKGVVNMVTGTGAEVGNAIVESADVDLISFTGGTKTGKHIMKTAADTVKKVSLELGGKSPNIVFDDTDLETVVDHGLFGIFYGTGQVCSAGSRILVQDTIYDKYVERFVERAKKIKVGFGNAEGTEIGPLVSQQHMEKVLSYIEIGKEEGATLACGGNRITTGGLENGYFVEPTVFTNVTSDMRIVQEEIFGPVVVIQKFSTEEEAIALANGTVYGLAAGVFTNDGARGMRVIKKLKAGITWINAFGPTYNEAPWGGYKQSGVGRNLGTFGLDEFQEVKQINVNLEVGPVGYFQS